MREVKKLKKLSVVLFLVLIVGIVFLVTKPTPDLSKPETSQPEKVSVRLKWLDQAQFAGIYAAKSQGFYSQNNLEVEILPGGPDISPVQMVVSGVNDFGITGGDQILLAREKSVPVVAVAVLYKQSPVAIGSLKEKAIVSPKDLEGKRVGLIYGRDEETIYRALMAKESIDESMIEEISLMAGLAQITTDKVDAQILYEINEPILLEQQGFEVDLIKPRDYGIQFYADTLFTTEELINNKPEVVRGFVKATLEGWQWVLENPEKAIDGVLEVNSSLDREHQTEFLQRSIPLIADEGKLGYSENKVWQEMRSVLLGQGILKEEVVVDKAFTNDYLN